MRVVAALGGNALLQRGQPLTAENQRANVRRACAALAPIASEHELVISHGNGPQVGLLALQGEQPDLRTVAVRDDQLVLARDRRQRSACPPDIRPLVLGGQRLPALEQRVSSESSDHAHGQLPRVATRTALIVCIRFSASSNTIEAGDSNTSSVTSSAFRPYFSYRSSPTLVSV